MENDDNIKSIKLVPSKLKGVVNAPSSKSLTHRAIICSALSDGESEISNVTFSDDINATLKAVKVLGAEVRVQESSIIIKGISNKDNIKSDDISDEIEIYSNESASTLRFLIPIALCFNNNVRFTAEKGLLKRPLSVYFDIFNKQGVSYKYDEDDLVVCGKLASDNFIVDGSISSQFISGLLFATPMLSGNSTITINGELQSKSYVDLTLDVLKSYGIKIINNDYKTFDIEGNQKYKATNYIVEGDFSQTSIFEIANFLGNEITIQNVNGNSLQGDSVILDIVEQMKNNDKNDDLVVDGSNCPDIIPIMALGACFRNATTKFVNIERLKIKECDRLVATYETLKKLGADIKIIEDNVLLVNGNWNTNFDGGITLSSYNDHRIAMLITIAATRCDNEIKLENPMCVTKSYPNFFDVIKSLGGEIIE